ncbi:MAG: alpha/beta hydrolase [Rickettsiales bacterium]|nr:alpha/beta hydrolase [Rickettsiales bacterium]
MKREIMEQKLWIDNKNYITYKIFDNNSKLDFDILYLHGFCGDMDGTKGTLIENIAKENNANLIKLNYLGHGTSSGKMTDFTMTDWLNNVKMIIDKFSNKKLLVIGSSMGGWLSYLIALEYNGKVKGIFTFSMAVDFLTQFVEPVADLNKDIVYEIINSDGTPSGNLITKKLLLDSKQYNLFNKKDLTFNCPIRMVHGMCDSLIPYSNSVRFAEKIKCKDLQLNLIKNADHRMKMEGNLDILKNMTEDFITLIH